MIHVMSDKEVAEDTAQYNKWWESLTFGQKSQLYHHVKDIRAWGKKKNGIYWHGEYDDEL